MQTHSKIAAQLVVSVVLLMFAGCSRYGASSSRQPDLAAQRFQPATPGGPTAVESAIELSERYAKLSEEVLTLRQQKQQLDAENQTLKEQLGSCRNELGQTEKNLAEANDLLVEMRLELNNWKNDILGYRDEMRDAEKAQLEALVRILKLLGGEVRTETKEAGGTPATTQHTNPSEQK